MARKNFNRDRALAFVLNTANDRLDALFFAAKAKIGELKLKENESAVDAHEFPKDQVAGTGNIRSLLDWVENLCQPSPRELPKDPATAAALKDDIARDNKRANKLFKEDCENLVLLHACISRKFSSVKYEPKPVKTQEEVDEAKKEEEAQQAKSNKRARRAARKREIEKAGTL